MREVKETPKAEPVVEQVLFIAKSGSWRPDARVPPASFLFPVGRLPAACRMCILPFA